MIINGIKTARGNYDVLLEYTQSIRPSDLRRASLIAMFLLTLCSSDSDKEVLSCLLDGIIFTSVMLMRAVIIQRLKISQQFPLP